MPKQHLFKRFSYTLVAAGGAVVLLSVHRLSLAQLDWRFLLLALCTFAVASRLTIKIPNPQERSQGHGVRFASQLSRCLVPKTKSVSLLVNEKDQVAQACYRKAGYKECGYYDTVYLRQ